MPLASIEALAGGLTKRIIEQVRFSIGGGVGDDKRSEFGHGPVRLTWQDRSRIGAAAAEAGALS